MEEDEVNSVAQMLGDLVTYRASGTGHLEFLAGVVAFLVHDSFYVLMCREKSSSFFFIENQYMLSCHLVGTNIFFFH